MTDRYPLGTSERLPFFFRSSDSFKVWKKFADAADLEFTNWNAFLDKIENARTPETIPTSELRHKISNFGGEIPSFFPEATRAAWTRQLIQFFKAKQSHENIEDAIRTVLGIAVNLRAPWTATPVYTVGQSLVGLDTIIQVGTSYKPPNPDAYVVGTALVASALVGAHGINVGVPRTVYVIFQIIPSDDQLLAVRYLVGLLKAAEEHCIFITPKLGQCWVLNESVLFLDTVLCAGSGEEECYTVDISRVGLSATVCGPTPVAGATISVTGPPLFPPGGDAPTEDAVEECFALLLPTTGDTPPQFSTSVCDGTYPANEIDGDTGLTVTTLGNLIGP